MFDIKKLDADPEQSTVYGIQVEQGKKGKLEGKCAESVKKALLDAGKCDK